MKLRPLLHLDLRREKVYRHYYCELERWWELSEQAEVDWRQQRSRIDKNVAPGAMRQDLGDGVLCSEAARLLDEGHTWWFRTTERECDDAEEHPHQDPERKHLISKHGVVVVIVPAKRENLLVTAFRPDPLTPDAPDFVRSAHAYVKRCAVRRAHRRTSYWK